MAKNCWELIFCGREPNGHKAAKLGVCPAAADRSHHGKNGGTNAGRYCWRVAGTLCGGDVQGLWARKIDGCLECKFYLHVRRQEGSGFVM